MTTPVVVDYYSDILCVWAWIAQQRIEVLNDKLVGKIAWRYHYLDVFGDARHKIPNQWQDKGGFLGFSSHVKEAAAPYPGASIHSEVWKSVRPNSSANPHLVLKAIEVMLGDKVSVKLAQAIRHAFFVEGQDISQLSVLFALIEKSGYEINGVKAAINDGRAIGALMADYQQAKLLSLKGSPTYIIDNGRQILYGNVGYRVLRANIEEHLHQSD